MSFDLGGANRHELCAPTSNRFTLITLLVAAELVLSTLGAWAENKLIKPPAKSIPIPFGRDIGEISVTCRERAPTRCTLSEFMSYARVCALAVVKSGKIRLVRFNSNRDICKEPTNPTAGRKRTELPR